MLLGVILLACPLARSATLESLESLRQAVGAHRTVPPLGYPRRSGFQTLKAEYRGEEELALLLEKSEEFKDPHTKAVTIHRLSQFFVSDKGSKNSVWEDGVPRSLTIQSGKRGVRFFRTLRQPASAPVRSFEQALTEDLFSEQTYVTTEGRERVEAEFKRDERGLWVETRRTRKAIKPSHFEDKAWEVPK